MAWKSKSNLTWNEKGNHTSQAKGLLHHLFFSRLLASHDDDRRGLREKLGWLVSAPNAWCFSLTLRDGRPKLRECCVQWWLRESKTRAKLFFRPALSMLEEESADCIFHDEMYLLFMSECLSISFSDRVSVILLYFSSITINWHYPQEWNREREMHPDVDRVSQGGIEAVIVKVMMESGWWSSRCRQ